MGQPLEVLLVEDREDDEILIARCLTRAGYDPHIRRVETEAAMREALLSRIPEIILSDYVLPRFSCEGALRVLRESGLEIPFIALSGTVNEETILTLVRAGAGDYVMKDNLARLPSSVQREIREAEGRRQRKRLEAQLQQAMKMEAIGRLAGGVAHDFNNLLTVITGFAQLALLDDNPARVGLEQIMLAAERASGLTRQLLAFSRQQALEPRVFDVNGLVRDMEKMLRRLIGEDIEVITQISKEPLTVKADPGQIEAGGSESGRQFARCHAEGRQTDSEHGRAADGGAGRGGERPDRQRLLRDLRHGQRVRNLRTRAATYLRTVFHYEARRAGHGAGAVNGIWDCEAVGRIDSGPQREGCRHNHDGLPPCRGRGFGHRFAAGCRFGWYGPGNDTGGRRRSDGAESGGALSEGQGIPCALGSERETALDMLHAQGPAGVDLLITDVVMPEIAGPVLATRATAN